MPITEQLQQAGLPHNAAVLLAEKIEAAAQATHRFCRFLTQALGDMALDRFRTELRGEVGVLRGEIAALDARISARFADVSARFGDVGKSIRTAQTVLLSALAVLLTVTGGLGTAILTVLLRR